MADEPVTEEAQGTPRNLTVDERNKPILDIVGDQAVGRTSVGDLGPGKVDLQGQQVQQNELLSTTDKKFQSDLPVSSAQFTQSDSLLTGQATVPSATGVARTIDISQVPLTNTQIPSAVNVDGVLSNQSQVQDANVVDDRTREQLLTRGTLATAQTASLAQEATVEFQVAKLYESLEEGKPLPAWASANVKKVQDIMNKRGLGASSVAAAAMVQAIAESALPIAVQDANRHATLQLQNLNNEQQAALTNAATISAMDKQNLDNRMKAAQQNAQTFLSMDVKNLDLTQQSNLLNYQTKVQSLFTDTAAENARLQFNAKNQTQVNEFYDQLGSSLATNNANREAATDQFNVDQSNSIKKYNAKIADERDKFNSNMRAQIDQSNALWRRQINTANTAEQNNANRINAAAILGLTTASQNNLWQEYRDEASFAFTASENDLQRNQQLALTAIANQFAEEMFEAQVDADSQKSIGVFLGRLLETGFSGVAKGLQKLGDE